MSDLKKEEYRKAFEHGKGVGVCLGSNLPERFAPLTFDSWYNELMEKKAKWVETSKETALDLDGAIARFYTPDQKPRVSEDNESFSVDVFIMDESGMHGIACWSYEEPDPHWIFHTDTLVDYFEEGEETKWKWYYPPYEKDLVMP